ncbi:MAG TPA: hypothetical protein VHY83_13575 [Solirubrobacteraceae bacterium]|nr:hypothetical protein [Solirubrobacteraceae bacterium]
MLLSAFWVTASAAAEPQKIEFTSSPPEPGLVGGSYTPTATATSGLPVTFSIASSSEPRCSISKGKVEFLAPGQCVIDANQEGELPAWEPAPQKEQEVEVKRPQTIEFTSTPPNPGTVGSTYSVAAVGGGSESPVVFTIDPSTVAACTISGSVVSFLAPGPCILDANQAAVGEYAAAAQAQQPITVVEPPPVTVVPGPSPPPPPSPSPAPAPSPGPVPSLGNSNFTAGVRSFEPRTGRVVFYETITDPGTFTWLLTVPNGKFGVFSSSKKKCTVGLVRLAGRCRPSKIVFATGSASVPAGVVIFKLRPSPNALKALKNALKQSRGLLVTATFTFQSSRGGSPVTHTQTLRVKLKG